MILEEKYDLIVGGGIYAGCELLTKKATLGSKTLLVTQKSRNNC